MQIIRVQSCKENPSPFSHQISTILFLLIQPDTQKLVNKCNKQGHPDNKQPKAFGGIFALRASSSGTPLGAHSPSSLSTELTILHWVTSCLLISMDGGTGHQIHHQKQPCTFAELSQMRMEAQGLVSVPGSMYRHKRVSSKTTALLIYPYTKH